MIFVTPASSQNECTPFKSEHTPGLDPLALERVEQMPAQGKEAMQAANWQVAPNLLETGAGEDPRHAELNYRRGRALLALGRFDGAKTAFRIARDEDLCPLHPIGIAVKI